MIKTLLIAAMLIAFAGCTTTPGPESPALYNKLAPLDLDHESGDTAPEPLKQVAPEYPFKYIGKVSGRAVVEFIIEKDGSVQLVRIKSQTDPLFGDAAAAAIKKWHFKPGQKAGLPVRCAMEMPFEFDASGAK
jgi:TonB family protein